MRPLILLLLCSACFRPVDALSPRPERCAAFVDGVDLGCPKWTRSDSASRHGITVTSRDGHLMVNVQWPEGELPIGPLEKPDLTGRAWLYSRSAFASCSHTTCTGDVSLETIGASDAVGTIAVDLEDAATQRPVRLLLQLVP